VIDARVEDDSNFRPAMVLKRFRPNDLLINVQMLNHEEHKSEGATDELNRILKQENMSEVPPQHKIPNVIGNAEDFSQAMGSLRITTAATESKLFKQGQSFAHALPH